MENFEMMQGLEEIEEESATNKYLTMYINQQCYGIPIELVMEIIGMQKVASVPEFPYYAKGIINLRGLIVPLIDVNLRLGYDQQEYTDKTCVIVVNVHGIEIGLIVDEVDEVIDIRDADINPPPKNSTVAADEYVSGIAVLPDKLILQMSCEKIIGTEFF